MLNHKFQIGAFVGSSILSYLQPVVGFIILILSSIATIHIHLLQIFIRSYGLRGYSPSESSYRIDIASKSNLPYALITSRFLHVAFFFFLSASNFLFFLLQIISWHRIPPREIAYTTLETLPRYASSCMHACKKILNRYSSFYYYYPLPKLSCWTHCGDAVHSFKEWWLGGRLLL